MLWQWISHSCMLCEKYFPLDFTIHLMLPCSYLLRKGKRESFELPSLDDSFQQAEGVLLFLLLSLVFPIMRPCFYLLLTLSDMNASGWKCQCYMPALSWIFFKGFRQSRLATSENEENNWGEKNFKKPQQTSKKTKSNWFLVLRHPTPTPHPHDLILR